MASSVALSTDDKLAGAGAASAAPDLVKLLHDALNRIINNITIEQEVINKMLEQGLETSDCEMASLEHAIGLLQKIKSDFKATNSPLLYNSKPHLSSST